MRLRILPRLLLESVQINSLRGGAVRRKNEQGDSVKEPKLVSRRLNKQANVKIGRTISEKRERMETSSERMENWKKGKRKKTVRVLFVILGFVVVFGIIARYMGALVAENANNYEIEKGNTNLPDKPGVPVIDLAAGEHKITSRMNEFIVQAEREFKELGYQLERVEIPAGSIRQMNFFVKDNFGYIKMTTDRGAAVSVEDADRMIRYLTDKGISEFEYIDVRVEEKGYWK